MFRKNFLVFYSGGHSTLSIAELRSLEQVPKPRERGICTTQLLLATGVSPASEVFLKSFVFLRLMERKLQVRRPHSEGSPR